MNSGVARVWPSPHQPEQLSYLITLEFKNIMLNRHSLGCTRPASYFHLSKFAKLFSHTNVHGLAMPLRVHIFKEHAKFEILLFFAKVPGWTLPFMP